MTFLSRRVIVKNISILFSGSVLAQGMTMVTLLITARQLGPLQYGQYAGSYVFVSFSAIAFNLGLDIWLLREGGRETSNIDSILTSVLTIKTILGLLWLGIVFLLSPSLNGLFHSNSFLPAVVRYSAISVLLDSLFNSVLVAHKAVVNNKMTAILEGGSDTVWFLATLLLVIKGQRETTQFLQCRILVLLGSLILASLSVRLDYRVNILGIKNVLKEILPYATSDFLAQISMRVDVLIVAIVLGSEMVGLYSPVVAIVNSLFLIPSVVYMVMVPVLSSLFAVDTQQAWKTSKNVIILLFFIGLGLMGGVAYSGNFIVSLLGENYEGSIEIIRILVWVLFLHSSVFSFAAIIVATNQQKHRVLVQSLVVVVNIMLNFFASRWLGITGVAWVYVITESILLLGYGWVVYRVYYQGFTKLESLA